MSIRLRLTLWYAGLLGIALAIFTVLIYVTLLTVLTYSVDEALRLRASQLASRLLPSGGMLDPEELGPQLELSPLEEFAAPGIYVQVLDDRGRLVAASANLAGGQVPPDPDAVAAALNGTESLVTVTTGGGIRVRLLTTPVFLGRRTVGVVQVAQSLAPLETVMRLVSNMLVAVAVAVLVLAVAGGWIMARRALAPIQQVTDSASRIAATGDFAERIPAPGTQDEMGRLINTFNHMIGRIQESFEAQRRLVADTSHELRNPLTVIRGNLELLRRDLDPETRLEAVVEAEEEAARMSRMVADLLLLAQADARVPLGREPVRLHALVEEVGCQARLMANGRQVEVGPLEETTVLGDRDRLKQMLMNLVENAVRYTPEGGRVSVGLRRQNGRAYLTVADTGVGIAPEHLPHIFERFYRADPSRSRTIGGNGLGLAIVKYVAEAHGGRVSVQSQVGKGSVFTVELEAAPVRQQAEGAGRTALEDP